MNAQASILRILPLGTESPVSAATPTMWSMVAFVAAMVIGIAILALIVRDAVNDEAGWLHWAGALATWIGLAVCFEVLQALALSPPAKDGTQRVPNVDTWIVVGLRFILYAAIPTLTLLVLAKGKDLWSDREAKKADEQARRLRGTLRRE